jgi:hypothetical protein
MAGSPDNTFTVFSGEGTGSGLFSFIEYRVLKLVPVNLGFLLQQPQASEPHSEICNVFWMRLSQPDGVRAQFVTAHYCYQRESIQKNKALGASIRSVTLPWFQRRDSLIG